MAAALATLRRFGYRNLAYLAFVAALFPLAFALDAGQIGDPEDGAGLGIVLALWAVVSVAFFAVNAVLAVIAGANGRPLGRVMIAYNLPPLCVFVAMAVLSYF
jgi:hypothetical protein